MKKFDGIILHVGLHKTGTTSIQSHLARHIPALAERDIGVFSYPGFFGNSSFFFRTLLDAPLGGKLLDRQVIDDFRNWAETCTCKRLLFSAEFLSIASLEQWKVIASFLNPWLRPHGVVRIQMVVRHPESWMASFRNQMSKSKEAASFSWQRGKWPQPLTREAFENTFSPMWEGQCVMEVKKFEEMAELGIWTGFVSWLGLPAEEFRVNQTKTLNTSVAMETRWVLEQLPRRSSLTPRHLKALRETPGVRDGLTNEEAGHCWEPNGIGPQLNEQLKCWGLPPYEPAGKSLNIREQNLFAPAFCAAWREVLNSWEPEALREVSQAMGQVTRTQHFNAASVRTKIRFIQLWVRVKWRIVRSA